ncbi:MAG TPA: hypothetical protein VGH27_22235 [Streptosporangiaceae bacterium]|jgi:hypothetical protein
MVRSLVVYQERYRWTARAGWGAGWLFVLLMVAIVVPIAPLVHVVTGILFGGLCLVIAAPSLSRRTALRVDERGITLGGSPFHYRASTRVFAWGDIERVVLWDRITASQARRGRPGRMFPPVRCIGLQLRAGAPPINGKGPSALDQAASAAPVPGVARGTVRLANSWTLDKGRLIAVTAQFAPQVQVLDLSQGTIAGH